MIARRLTRLAAALAVAAFTVEFVAAAFIVVPVDWRIYMAAGRRWLETGAYFNPDQLVPGHQVVVGDVLYPPAGLALFVPFTFLPPLAWWLVPLGVIAAAIVRLRPSAVTIGFMALLACDPYVIGRVYCGNPEMFLVAALFAWAAWGLPTAAVILLKPSVLPFALPGIRRRGWWAIAGAIVLLNLIAWPLTRDWIWIVLNTQGTQGALYSLWDVPVLLIPLVAWAGSDRGAPWVARLARWRTGLPGFPAPDRRLT